ncbi:hypothetical protein [Spirosoma sordidisoli]|uniref:Uncharacterized protein n=1 Tax=Spirosoma sordidisoli TaxID=2502893 RepID=A0A4Q2UC61_9BACT|nr:hypothetical protein [Spirosoma sordidisoli]RYC66346.1 hypothetical protein EQG79_30190 [Spirosoma sordidisoli]
MKRRVFLESILTKGGLTAAEITDTLGDLEGDLADDRAEAAQAALLTEDEAAASEKISSKIKTSARAEVLTSIDAIVKTYENKLTAAQKTELAKLGTDAHKRSQFVLKCLDEKGTQSGDEARNALQSELDELKEDLANKYVPKSDYEQITGQVSTAHRRATEAEIVAAARTNPHLRDVSKDRHFRTNLIQDANTLLTETGLRISERATVKGRIDYATGKILKADDTNTPVQINGRDATIHDLVEQTIKTESFDWAKKSDGSPNGSTIIPADQKNTQLSKAQAANLADD